MSPELAGGVFTTEKSPDKPPALKSLSQEGSAPEGTQTDRRSEQEKAFYRERSVDFPAVLCNKSDRI